MLPPPRPMKESADPESACSNNNLMQNLNRSAKTKSEIRNPKSKIPKSKNPKSKIKIQNPKIPKSRILKIPKSQNPKSPKSQNLKSQIPKSQNPKIQNQKSKNPISKIQNPRFNPKSKIQNPNEWLCSKPFWVNGLTIPFPESGFALRRRIVSIQKKRCFVKADRQNVAVFYCHARRQHSGTEYSRCLSFFSYRARSRLGRSSKRLVAK